MVLVGCYERFFQTKLFASGNGRILSLYERNRPITKNYTKKLWFVNKEILLVFKIQKNRITLILFYTNFRWGDFNEHRDGNSCYQLITIFFKSKFLLLQFFCLIKKREKDNNSFMFYFNFLYTISVCFYICLLLCKYYYHSHNQRTVICIVDILYLQPGICRILKNW